MIDLVRSIGIDKGKSFNPNAKTKAILDRAAHDAHAWLVMRYEALFVQRGYTLAAAHLAQGPRRHGDFLLRPRHLSDRRTRSDVLDGFFSPEHLGTGQFYLMTIKDKSGNPFDGGQTYRLTVSANVPVNLYWSATAYDRATHALIREVSRASRGSNRAREERRWLIRHLLRSPTVPAGKGSNWVPTNASGQFEALFRFYGPKKPLLEKTWKPPDFQKMDSGTLGRALQ